MLYPAFFRSVIWMVVIVVPCIFTSCRSSGSPSYNRKVFISHEGGKYVLYRNNRPYLIKGAAGFENLHRLQLSGGNTIRVWDTVNLKQVLDEAYANNIAVIAGLPMPVSGILSYYNDRSKVTAQLNAFRSIVKKYSTHPALLMWCLGNEVDFPYKPRFNNFYKAYRNLLKMIHEEDPDHPVTTALINFERRCIFNLCMKVPDLDLISLNTFGSLYSLQKDLNQFSWFWNGPFLITEWGVKGPWEADLTAWRAPIEYNSTVKAEQYLRLYEHSMPVKDPRFLGAFVFLWGHKQEVTHTWFNLFDVTGYTSETVNVMQYLWTGKWPAHKAPQIKDMMLDGKQAKDNIILNSKTEHTAEVFLQQIPDDTARIHWEILKEDWYARNWYEPNTKKPSGHDSLLLTLKGYKVLFRTPEKEGPYRIFATFSDARGYFASANIPFYVVEQ
ncbi:glycoside hydrolase family 2 TIM barrel-domain containing protein [Chitinophaga niabensis]|uniref:Glycosyl hydrolases family 2, TIM barrel domain n=1 Tax=Chitinophaga niabensis TaxID=536979 RepID=A0A1N6K137_9BACT|nr:glycoside hydrolase family 2 TIM barrel-domain containing protein [Chitinophaga niabensis]SIO50046.1 Glycosyl hydrolases family 2, TIM barrel domain [Chitinophaga niabensis]